MVLASVEEVGCACACACACAGVLALPGLCLVCGDVEAMSGRWTRLALCLDASVAAGGCEEDGAKAEELEEAAAAESESWLGPAEDLEAWRKRSAYDSCGLPVDEDQADMVCRLRWGRARRRVSPRNALLVVRRRRKRCEGDGCVGKDDARTYAFGVRVEKRQVCMLARGVRFCGLAWDACGPEDQVRWRGWDEQEVMKAAETGQPPTGWIGREKKGMAMARLDLLDLLTRSPTLSQLEHAPQPLSGLGFGLDLLAERAKSSKKAVARC